MDWTYATLREDGRLVDDAGDLVLAEDITFETVQQAEDYCFEKDYRITVR